MKKKQKERIQNRKKTEMKMILTWVGCLKIATSADKIFVKNLNSHGNGNETIEDYTWVFEMIVILL